MIILEFIPDSPTLMGLVDLDYTFFVELGVFLLLMIILNKMFFQPLQRNLDHRQAAIGGARDEAEKMSGEATDLVEKRRAAVNEAREKAYTLVNQLKNEGEEQERELLKTAQKAVEERLASGKAELAKALEKSHAETDRESDLLADLIVAKLLEKT